MLVQILQVLVRDQKTQRIAIDGLSSQDNKLLGPLAQKARETGAQHLLQLICLFDADRHPDRVDRGFDEALYVLVTADTNFV